MPTNQEQQRQECEFCGRKGFNERSNTLHKIRCKKNPNGKFWYSQEKWRNKKITRIAERVVSGSVTYDELFDKNDPINLERIIDELRRYMLYCEEQHLTAGIAWVRFAHNALVSIHNHHNGK